MAGRGNRDYYDNTPGVYDPAVATPGTQWARDLETTLYVQRQTEKMKYILSMQQLTNANRDQYLSDMQSLAGGQNTMSGESRINGAGDIKLFLQFACQFSEKPIFTFGGEIMETKSLEEGNFPSISAFVYDWITEERPPTSVFYTGAILAVSITGGDPTSKYIIHWSFSGRGFTGPSGITGV